MAKFVILLLVVVQILSGEVRRINNVFQSSGSLLRLTVERDLGTIFLIFVNIMLELF
jgi:hypothetical protein